MPKNFYGEVKWKTTEVIECVDLRKPGAVRASWGIIAVCDVADRKNTVTLGVTRVTRVPHPPPNAPIVTAPAPAPAAATPATKRTGTEAAGTNSTVPKLGRMLLNGNAPVGGSPIGTAAVLHATNAAQLAAAAAPPPSLAAAAPARASTSAAATATVSEGQRMQIYFSGGDFSRP